MFRAKVSTEQADSLKAQMQVAGLQHGDTAEVEFTGVGVKAELGERRQMCFCPVTRLEVVGAIRRGTPEERRQPIPEVVTYSREATKAIRAQTPNQGFLSFTATVHSNGTIKIFGIRDVQFEAAPGWTVNHHDSYRSFQVVKAGS